jgi:hypothetical protein
LVVHNLSRPLRKHLLKEGRTSGLFDHKRRTTGVNDLHVDPVNAGLGCLIFRQMVFNRGL